MALVEQVFDYKCQACPLHQGCRHVCVPGRRLDKGRIQDGWKPRVLIVGEAPGPTEDEVGLPFVGRAGKKLEEYIQQTHLDPAEIYLTNIVKCFPRTDTGYRDPKPDEVRQCTALYLENEICLLEPEWIVPMGNTALEFFTGHSQVTRYRGKVQEVALPTERWLELLRSQGQTDLPEQRLYNVLPTFHPAAALYQMKYEGPIMQDLAYIREKLTGQSSIHDENFRYCWDKETFDTEMDAMETLTAEGSIDRTCLDVETSGPMTEEERKHPQGGLDPYDPQNLLLCFALAYRLPTGSIISVGIPYQHPESPWAEDRVMLDYICWRVTKVLQGLKLFNHNLKFDLRWLFLKGFRWGELWGCTMLKSWVLHNSLVMHNLENLAGKYCGIISHKQEMVQEQKRVGTIHMGYCSLPIVLKYNCLDVDTTFRLDLAEDQALQEQGLAEVNDRIMTKSILPHTALELGGMALDQAQLDRVAAEYLGKIAAQEQQFKDWGYAEAVEQHLELKPGSFNLGSNDHVAALLTHCLQVDTKLAGRDAFTDRGKVCTSKDVLEMYIAGYREYILDPADHGRASPEGQQLSDWCQHLVMVLQSLHDLKSVRKIYSTYVAGLPKYLHADHLLHPNYGVCCTDTSRDSAQDPGVQTIPHKSVIKQSFVSRWLDGLILQADYAQLELRVLAMLSGEQQLIKLFQEGRDVHREFCARLHAKPIEQVTDDERRFFKCGIFAIVYGGGAASVAAQTGAKKEASQELIDWIFATMPDLSRWIQRQHAMVRSKGYVETAAGWRRYLPSDQFSEEERERRAQNTPVQGSAAFLGTSAMQRLYAATNPITRPSKIKSTLHSYVHDSLSYDLHPGEVIPIATLLQKQMVDMPPRLYPWTAGVPLGIDQELGANWRGGIHMKMKGGNTVELDGVEEQFQLLFARITAWPDPITPTVLEMEDYIDREKRSCIRALVDFPTAPYLTT